MKKMKIISALLALAMLLTMLAGCACEHDWTPADCLNPLTCKLCGETAGDKLQTHQWKDATTEAPKTCAVCGLTEGDRIRTDPRFRTADCQHIFGTWECNYASDEKMAEVLESMGVDAGELQFSLQVTMTFFNDGKMEGSVKLDEQEKVLDALCEILAAETYAQMAQTGMNKEQADAAFQVQFGKGVKEYWKQQIQTMLEAIGDSVQGVYYVQDGKLYLSSDWDEDMEDFTLEMKDGKMLLTQEGETIEFTKAEN